MKAGEVPLRLSNLPISALRLMLTREMLVASPPVIEGKDPNS